MVRRMAFNKRTLNKKHLVKEHYIQKYSYISKVSSITEDLV